MNVLSEEQGQFYREQGYVIVENFLSTKEVQLLKGALDRLINEKATTMTKDENGFNLEKKREVTDSPFSGDIVGAGVLRKIQEVNKHSAEYAEFMESDKMLNLVEDLIGPTIYYHSSKLMFNTPGIGKGKPWHQDYAYWQSTRPEQVTCWIALDDATKENGCMQLIPKSHTSGLLDHKRAELQVEANSLPLDKVKFAEMKAGSLLAFHVLTLHHSKPNLSDKTRRALIVDYDPNKRIDDSGNKGGFAGDRLLRIEGRKPTKEEAGVEAVAV